MKTKLNLRMLLLLAVLFTFFESIFSQSTLVIDTCYWSQINDCDGDGYASSKWIVIDYQGTSLTGHGKIEIWAFNFIGDSILLLPVRDFPILAHSGRQGFYVYSNVRSIVNVTVKILGGSNNVNNIFSFSDSCRFEPENEDLKTQLQYIVWDNDYNFDNDNDGYYSNSRLYFHINTCTISFTDTFYFKIYTCKNDSSEFDYYYTSPIYNTNNLISEHIFGSNNGELTHGIYSIKFQLFRARTNEILTDTIYNKSIYFETKNEDGLFSIDFNITHVFIDCLIDKDKDDYLSSFNLNFNIEIDTGTYKLHGFIFSKKDESNYFNYWGDVNDFIISESNAKVPRVYIHPSNRFSRNGNPGLNDFLIEIYLDKTLVATLNCEDDSALNDIKLESRSEDSPFHIKDYSLSNIIDYDGDGKPSKADLNIVFDVIDETDSVFLRSMLLVGELFAFPFTTEPFIISPGDTSFTFHILNNWIPNRTSLCLRSKSLGTIFNGELEYDCTGLNLNMEFENNFNDNIVTVNSFKIIDSLDADGDGYFSKKSYELDFSNFPDTAIIKMQIYFLNINTNLIYSYPVDYCQKIDTTNKKIFSIPYYINLPQGIYNINLQISNCHFSSEIKISNFNLFSNQLLESPINDELSIKSTSIDNRKDFDKDGYNSSFDIYLDSVVTQRTYPLTGKIFFRKNGILLREVSVPKFNVSVDSSTYLIYSTIEDDYFFEKGLYDISIELFYLNKLFTNIRSSDDPDIYQFGIERINEDSPFLIKNFTFSNLLDYDGDGYPSRADLKLEFKSTTETDSVFCLISSYNCNITDPVQFFGSQVFIISPDDTIHTITFRNTFISDCDKAVIYLVNSKIGNLISYKLNSDTFYIIEPFYDLIPLNVPFEGKNSDILFTAGYSIIDSTDSNLDGYCQNKVYTINVNSFPLSSEKELRINLLRHSDGSIFYSYPYSNIAINDSTDDSFTFEIYRKNLLIAKGIYDIEIEIKGITKFLLCKNQKLELEMTDLIQFIPFDLSFKNKLDFNKDIYSRSGQIHINAFVSNKIKSVFAKIVYMKSGSDYYSLLQITDPVEINHSDITQFDLPFNFSVLSHNLYDFEILIYNESNDSLLEKIDPAEDIDLYNQKFELASEDVCSFSIHNTYFDVNRIDLDQDGYYQTGNLHYNTTVDVGNHDVVAKILYRGSEDAGYTYFYETPSFMLNGAEEEIFCITIDSSLVLLPHDSYDFRIELFYEDDDSLLAEIGPSDDPYLNDQKFEMEEEDHITSLTEFQSGSTRVFPNPVSSDLTIYLNELTENEFFKVKVYTNQGNLLKEFELKSVSEGNKIAFGDLMPGMYVIQIQSGKYLDYLRIVKY